MSFQVEGGNFAVLIVSVSYLSLIISYLSLII